MVSRVSIQTKHPLRSRLREEPFRRSPCTQNIEGEIITCPRLSALVPLRSTHLNAALCEFSFRSHTSPRCFFQSVSRYCLPCSLCAGPIRPQIWFSESDASKWNDPLNWHTRENHTI